MLEYDKIAVFEGTDVLGKPDSWCERIFFVTTGIFLAQILDLIQKYIMVVII